MTKKRIICLVILGLLLSGVSVLATYLIESSDVGYDNSTSGLSSDNVEGAINELYIRTATLQSENASLQEQLANAVSQEDLDAALAACPSGKTCITNEGLTYDILANATPYYLIIPTDMRFAFDDPTSSSPTDYTQVGKNVFIGKSGNQKSVCIIYNNKLECFKNNNYENELEHGKQVFGESNCGLSDCNGNDFYCSFGDSETYCADYSQGRECFINDATVKCGKS